MGKYNKYKTGNINLFFMGCERDKIWNHWPHRRHSSSNNSFLNVTSNFHAFNIYNAITNPQIHQNCNIAINISFL